ncbi:30.6 kDa protein in fumA 3'region [Phlyctema vagabunda]|uniref:chitin deacetylase n=1 Tax=Phlyctema vagabunda TaxID=108571 RepID=A0ABR4P9H7_9HELO
MRLSLLPLFRRARRLAFNIPVLQLYRYLISYDSPLRAHFKIDDEQPIDHDHPAARQPRSPPSPLKRMLTYCLIISFIFFTLVAMLAWSIYKPPDFLIDYLQWKYPDVLFHVPLSQKMVALTLDDAPSTSTEKVLDVLKAYGVKATFFVIGSQVQDVPGRPELLQRMHDEGHEIGNHAWNDYPSIKLPLETLEKQMRDVEALLPPNTPKDDGSPPKYFRPGSGVFNKAMLGVAKSLGYRVVLGSIYPHDPQIPHPKINAAHVLSMVQPGGIIIMHDRRYYSAEQLELVLKGLIADDWKVESVGGLLKAAEEEAKHE